MQTQASAWVFSPGFQRAKIRRPCLKPICDNQEWHGLSMPCRPSWLTGNPPHTRALLCAERVDRVIDHHTADIGPDTSVDKTGHKENEQGMATLAKK